MDEIFLPRTVANPLGQIGRQVTHILTYGARTALYKSESLALACAVAQNASFRSSERGFVE
jgi:hypothetical protein